MAGDGQWAVSFVNMCSFPFPLCLQAKLCPDFLSNSQVFGGIKITSPNISFFCVFMYVYEHVHTYEHKGENCQLVECMSIRIMFLWEVCTLRCMGFRVNLGYRSLPPMPSPSHPVTYWCLVLNLYPHIFTHTSVDSTVTIINIFKSNFPNSRKFEFF